MGIGSAAHSHRAGVRWWNVRTPERYIDAIDAGRSPEAGREVLTDEQRDFEALSLSLRTPRGVPWGDLSGTDELAGLVEPHQGRAVLTVRGRLLANEVTTENCLRVVCTDDRRRPGQLRRAAGRPRPTSKTI